MAPFKMFIDTVSHIETVTQYIDSPSSVGALKETCTSPKSDVITWKIFI